MNIKSKLVTLTTAAVLTLTLAGNSFAAGTPFKDLANVNEKDKILSLQDRGYVNGDSDGFFVPGRTLIAAEGVQLIVNTFGLNLDTIRFIKEPKATDYYQKADNNAWYAQALIIASVNGVYFPNDFDPNQEWTREEFTYQLIKAAETHANLPMIKLIPVKIADGGQLTTGYEGAIQRALVYGVVKLDAAGKFKPKAKISRAEAAEQVYNMLEYMKVH